MQSKEIELQLKYIEDYQAMINLRIKVIKKILDENSNQPDYKSAFEELKETIYKDSSDTVWLDETTTVIDEMEILEQKYNLGGE